MDPRFRIDGETPPTLVQVRDAIEAELGRAIAQHPQFPDDPVHAAAIVAEEAGELVQAALDGTYKNDPRQVARMRDEALQVGAMAYRFLIHLHGLGCDVSVSYQTHTPGEYVRDDLPGSRGAS